MGICLPEAFESGRMCRSDGIVFGIFAVAPAVEDDEGDGFLGVHGGNYTTVLCLFKAVSEVLTLVI